MGGAGARVIRLAVRVAREHAELVLAELAELAPGRPGGARRRRGHRRVRRSTARRASCRRCRTCARRPAARSSTSRTTELADDWDVRWRTWHPAVVVEAGGRTLRVRPPWEAARAGTIDVAIEPAQAFGTGAHETTRLSLALLMGLRAPAAARGLGLRLGRARDRRGQARLRARGRPATSRPPRWRRRATARASTASRSRCRAATCGARGGPWAPTVTANLVRPLLLEVAGRMERPPERLIVSGLLRAEAGEVAAAFAAPRDGGDRRREGTQWSALLLQSP